MQKQFRRHSVFSPIGERGCRPTGSCFAARGGCRQFGMTPISLIRLHGTAGTLTMFRRRDDGVRAGRCINGNRNSSHPQNIVRRNDLTSPTTDGCFSNNANEGGVIADFI